MNWVALKDGRQDGTNGSTHDEEHHNIDGSSKPISLEDSKVQKKHGHFRNGDASFVQYLAGEEVLHDMISSDRNILTLSRLIRTFEACK